MIQTPALVRNAYPGRILIVGGPGAGKSTFAIRLGQALSLPVFHMDALGWTPKGPLPPDQLLSKLEELAARPEWVIEGVLALRHPVLAGRADLVLFLDLRRRQRVWNWLKRRVRYMGRARPGHAIDFREPWGLRRFRRVWTWHRGPRNHLLRLIGSLPEGVRVIRLHSFQEYTELQNRLRQERTA